MDVQDQDQDGGGEDGSPDTAESTEGQLIYRVTLCLPCLSESDMRNVDAEPGEDG